LDVGCYKSGANAYARCSWPVHMPPQINVVSAYAYVVEEFLERTALWGYVNEATGFGNM